MDGILVAIKDEIDCLPYPTTGRVSKFVSDSSQGWLKGKWQVIGEQEGLHGCTSPDHALMMQAVWGNWGHAVPSLWGRPTCMSLELGPVASIHTTGWCSMFHSCFLALGFGFSPCGRTALAFEFETAIWVLSLHTISKCYEEPLQHQQGFWRFIEWISRSSLCWIMSCCSRSRWRG